LLSIGIYTLPVVLIPFIRHRKHNIQANKSPKASWYFGSPRLSMPLLILRNSLLEKKWNLSNQVNQQWEIIKIGKNYNAQVE
jgi:hypothetical protein